MTHTNKTRSKAIPFDGDLDNTHARLRVGNLLYLFNISHSSLYRRINDGSFPMHDGKDGRRPFWLASTIRPLIDKPLNTTKQ